MPATCTWTDPAAAAETAPGPPSFPAPESHRATDYMHARFCSPNVGRFLSFDQGPANLKTPQAWNRYAYALGNPVLYVDPTGETISVADLDDEERGQFLESLSGLTGNTYGVNDDNELIVVEYGAGASETGTGALDSLIASSDLYSVKASNSDPDVVFANQPTGTNDIVIDFADFETLDHGKVDPGAFSIATNFLHELGHAAFGFKDPGLFRGSSELGTASGFVNMVRSERGLPTRGPAYKGPVVGSRRRVKLNFQNVNPKRPNRIYYVYYPQKATGR